MGSVSHRNQPAVCRSKRWTLSLRNKSTAAHVDVGSLIHSLNAFFPHVPDTLLDSRGRAVNKRDKTPVVLWSLHSGVGTKQQRKKEVDVVYIIRS